MKISFTENFRFLFKYGKRITLLIIMFLNFINLQELNKFNNITALASNNNNSITNDKLIPSDINITNPIIDVIPVNA